MVNTPRTCTCRPGCTEIAKSNASPYAKGHNPNKKAKAKTKRVARRASPTRKKAATRVKQNSGVATICVTETNLDNFWAKLSLEEKAALYQQQLENA